MNLFQNFTRNVPLCVIIAGLIAATACVAPPSTQNSPPPQQQPTPLLSQLPATSKPMPPLIASHGGQAEKSGAGGDLSWRLVDGSARNFAAYRGKAVILDFWATYCPPCEEEIPHLVELSGRYKDDLRVVGLHVGGAEDKANIADFVSKYRMSYDLGYPAQALTDFYLQGDDRIPQTLVFDRRGNLVQKFVGFTPEIKAELTNAVEKALKVE